MCIPVLALVALLSLLAGCRTPPPRSVPNSDATSLIEAAERSLLESDYDAAIDAYQAAYARTPWNTRLRNALAATYARRAALARGEGDRAGLRRATADLRAGLKLAPDDENLGRNLAIVLIEEASRTGDPARAAALREEAGTYAPDLVAAAPVVQVRLERQLDLAYELIQRGQSDAAVETLERLHAAHPEHAATMVLLARSRVRLATQLAARRNFSAAERSLARAVDLYARLDHCRSDSCERSELALAHENRIRVLLHADRLEAARGALAAAEAAGLSFPELRPRLSAE